MNIIYRSIENSEAAFAAELEGLCLHTPWTEKQILDIPENALYLGAFSNDTLCGILSCYFVLDEVQIMNLAVMPQFRRMGVGQGLINAACSQALAKKCINITLEVAEDNISAISLYEKCGFTAVGKRKGFYGKVAAVLMEKIL